MVSFAMSFGNYGGAGNTASMLRRNLPRTRTNNSLLQAKEPPIPKGLTQTSPGNFQDSKANQVIRQGDKFYTLPTQADSAFGYVTVPTEYQPPPPTLAEQVGEKLDAVEGAVGTRTLVMDDLPRPSAGRLRTDEDDIDARRRQLRNLAGQRRSLLRPVARRPYYG